ncbi:hypothetical protein ACJX0J_014675, partial [Zea mays]
TRVRIKVSGHLCIKCLCDLVGWPRMFGRASPRMNLIQSAAMKKISPRSTTNKRKKRTSPKVGCLRANWNSGLEKGLVEILQDHNNDCYKGQNGWSSEAWNRIVKFFHEKFSYVTFTKCHIQDKEKELKRDYKALKEARQQSGVSWDERLCRIEAEEPIWNNLTTSNERLKKFRTKSFPLFEALGELYDGNIAEGTMNFTSIEPSRPHVTQPCQGAATQPSQAAFTLTQPSQIAFTQPSLAAFAQPSRTAFRHPSLPPSQTTFTQPSEDTFTQPSQAAFTQPSQLRERATTNANEDDFPIQTCIAIVDAYDVLQEHDMIYEAKVMKDDFKAAICAIILQIFLIT